MSILNSFEIRSYFEELSATVKKLPLPAIDYLARLLEQAYLGSHAVFLFGNGGSAALASHMACDLGKGTAPVSGKRLRAIALTDSMALITAWANDACYEDIFAEQLKTLLQPGDIALAISASGNSRNVLAALDCARRMGAATAGISGFEGGRMKALCDVCVVVPSNNMQIIEDLHLSIAHSMFHALRDAIHQANSSSVA